MLVARVRIQFFTSNVRSDDSTVLGMLREDRSHRFARCTLVGSILEQEASAIDFRAEGPQIAAPCKRRWRVVTTMLKEKRRNVVNGSSIKTRRW
jgi:hypothetical protein